MKQNITALQAELLRQLKAGNQIMLTFSSNSHVNPMSLVGFLAKRGVSASYVQQGGYIKLKASLNHVAGGAA